VGEPTDTSVTPARVRDDTPSDIVENSPDLLARYDPNGVCLYASPASLPLLGYMPEQLIGRRCTSFVHPDDQVDVSDAFFADDARSGSIVQYRARHNNGEWVWLETALQAVREEAGGTTEFIAVSRDITGRRAAEDAVGRRHERIVSTYETMREAFFSLDRDWRIVYMNPVAHAMRVRPAEEVMGQTLWEVFPDLRKTRFYSEYIRAVKERVHVSFEEYYPRIERWFHVSAYPTNEGLSVYFRDVTEEHGAREALVKREREMAEAYRLERETTEHLRALDDMKNMFLNAVSHELRTPLTIVLGVAEMLQVRNEELSDEVRAELLVRLSGSARKLERLLTDLLDLDRLARGILEPQRRPTDMADLVKRVVRETDVASTRSITVEAPSFIIDVDTPKVERIVENLLINAIRHTGPSTPVWISVEQRDGGAVITVADQGPGVPASLRDAIFEPFQRGTTPMHAAGIGIGLTLVARFTALHGGRVWVEDRPGGGAAFKVFLPDDAGAATEPKRVSMGTLTSARKHIDR
jgi:PAS domain S-box-containing protein